LIAVDTNILVYADRSELPRHQEAVDALRGLAEGDEAWALPLFCTAEFVRVVSHPRVFDRPTPPEEALAAVDALLESPSCRLLMPGPRYWALFEQAVRDAAASGNLVFDAQIVAVCLEHGARTILTEDRDFSRFPGVTVQPLKP
jgi:toxin-antitoxin system PIN domain toxin